MEITKESNIAEIVREHPETVAILFDYGVHCVGCHAASFENLGQGLQAHGLSEEKIEKIIKEMNEKIKETKKAEEKK